MHHYLPYTALRVHFTYYFFQANTVHQIAVIIMIKIMFSCRVILYTTVQRHIVINALSSGYYYHLRNQTFSYCNPWIVPVHYNTTRCYNLEQNLLKIKFRP